MSVAQTLLVFVLIPLAIYGFIALTTLRSKFARGPRYAPGDKWEFEPVWWAANPKGLDAAGSGLAELPEASAETGRKATASGGARGNW